RYLLPLVPFLLIFTARGIEWTMASARGHWRAGLGTLTGAALLYAFAFTFAVAFLQRGAFGDIHAAGDYIRQHNLDGPIYSNEFYKENLTSIKLSFWSGRGVQFLPQESFSRPILPPGSYVVLHSAYGGMASYKAALQALESIYDVRIEEVFGAWIIPLLPDIMEDPWTHQNPAAWFFRYRVQEFETVICQIRGPKS
ncbi:MAG: hypothetical protein V2A74_14530, partial [bacterium]